MIYGYSFKGIHISKFGALWKSKDRSLKPSRQKSKISVPGQNGSYKFSGNQTDDDRIISGTIHLPALSQRDLRNKARSIAAWLHGEGELIFDDEPDKAYIAEIYEGISLEQLVTMGSASVSFECGPYAHSTISTAEDVTWDSDVIWDSDITWGGSDNFTFSVNESPTVIEIENTGTVSVRPIITITGSFTDIRITINGKILGYSEAIAEETVTINNFKYTVKKGDINKLDVVTGDIENFLELLPGKNDITITGTGLNCTVLFDFKPLYI